MFREWVSWDGWGWGRGMYRVYDADHAVADAGVYGCAVEECGLLGVSDVCGEDGVG